MADDQDSGPDEGADPMRDIEQQDGKKARDGEERMTPHPDQKWGEEKPYNDDGAHSRSMSEDGESAFPPPHDDWGSGNEGRQAGQELNGADDQADPDMGDKTTDGRDRTAADDPERD